MKSYGQFCPIAKAAELFCERWTALVIRNVGAGAHRFTDIHRGVPLMSATLLSQRLRQLEAEGILERRRAATGRSWTYHLTEAGAEFMPLVASLGAWGRRWTRRDLAEGELDLGLLIWGLEHSVNAAAFGAGRVTVLLRVTDQPDHKALFWFVNEAGRLDLCVTDPGYEVDLWLSGALADLIHVYRGDVPLSRALEEDRLEALGAARLRRRLRAWLNPGPLNAVAPAVGAPLPG
ncbi:hypothetical protein DDZ14_10300 [Maritimibacter sp. 55A14]|uniref:winged helix-turn-helix transcriptional regulator n=1 Tax=Maritimibacter sp. 55A14 TaxID=2174844 RepID=UPI000D613A9D|nr:helix-turn-helix domain-containing protein [Maritimibacter sp. 55A14]PWE32445.1 hypothetical protein DDZ14_10300 [Maritimibacter sp. 55A14]